MDDLSIKRRRELIAEYRTKKVQEKDKTPSEDIKFYKDTGQKDIILKNAKAIIGNFLHDIWKLFIVITGIIAIAISIGGLGALLPIFPIIAGIIIIITIIVSIGIILVWLLGSLIAVGKSVYIYIDMVPYDGIAMWMYRIFVASLMSWKYVIIKDTKKKA